MEEMRQKAKIAAQKLFRCHRVVCVDVVHGGRETMCAETTTFAKNII